MQIKTTGISDITILGNIKSIEDSLMIKNALNAMQQNGAKSIRLNIMESFSMTSTVIGHLMKLINLDKVTVSMIVGDVRLLQLLDELSLVHAFNVRLSGK